MLRFALLGSTRCTVVAYRQYRPPNPDPLEQGRAMGILVRLRGVAVDRRPLCVGIALQFHHLIVTFRGGCFGEPPRLRFAQFIHHSIDACLALIAVVTNDHRQTLPAGYRPAVLV